MSEQWDRRRERGSLLGMRFTAWLYRRAGWRLAHLLVYPVVTYFFLTDRAGRRSSLEYLRRNQAAGACGLNGRISWRHAFRHYLEFGIAILDRVGFWLAEREDFELTVIGGEHLAWVIEQRRGAVVLGSHLGSFDAMRMIGSAQSPIDIKVLMYTEQAARVNEVFRRMGEISGHDASVGVIHVVAGSFTHAIEVKQAIARGEVVAILADRLHPNERGRGVHVEFLGERACLPQGPLLLAATLGCPVLLMAGLRSGDRRYEIHVERFADPVTIPRRDRARQLQYYAQSYADWLARLSGIAPLQWFNFYDFWAAEPAKSKERDNG